ncbi:hypothetical protein, partial [Nocardioides stalactiti]|uniref:hypothetical protein n=1 Tax=Nocardioides stalactiti TaxID=2755356 RepID=UPI0015FF22BA
TVRVRLSSEHATETLIQAAPELRRLLEQSGATDARVVVRDGDATATDLSSPDHRETRHEGGDRPGGDRDRERPGRRDDTRPEQLLTHRSTAPAADPTTTPTTTTGQLDRLV